MQRPRLALIAALAMKQVSLLELPNDAVVIGHVVIRHRVDIASLGFPLQSFCPNVFLLAFLVNRKQTLGLGKLLSVSVKGTTVPEWKNLLRRLLVYKCGHSMAGFLS